MEDFTSGVLQLYDKVLYNEKEKYSVENKSISSQIETMKEVYSSKGNWEKDQVSKVVDYNDPAARCAYLHKYAMCYTGMVNYLLSTAVMDCSLLNYLNEINKLKICSLGGGPGTDIVGILNVFTKFFGFKLYDVCIIDQKEDWDKTFYSVIRELRSGYYGNLSTTVLPNYFKYYYMQADLLSTPLSMNVKQAVSNSNFISMIKFISAAACNVTKQMVNDVFSSMKCGAVILFIDNAAGGFLQMLQKEANQCGMITVHGPLAHFEYINPAFALERFGYQSQSITKVSMQMWMKGFSQQIHNQHILLANLMGQQCLNNRPLSFDLLNRETNPRLRRNRKRTTPYDLNRSHFSVNPRTVTFQDSYSFNYFTEDTFPSEERMRTANHPSNSSFNSFIDFADDSILSEESMPNDQSFDSYNGYPEDEFIRDSFPTSPDTSSYQRMHRNWERPHSYGFNRSHLSTNRQRNTFQNSYTSFDSFSMSEDSFSSDEFVGDAFSSDRFRY